MKALSFYNNLNDNHNKHEILSQGKCGGVESVRILGQGAGLELGKGVVREGGELE